jgi:hypothetical protein
LHMDPAPGYDPRLPHDAAHFIVENELEITGAIFGQLAAGGTANTFHSENLKKPKRKKKQAGHEDPCRRHRSYLSPLRRIQLAVVKASDRWFYHSEVEPQGQLRVP